MTPEQKLARALEEMLPYAESRLEDMSEDARTTNPEHRAEARRLYANALLKYRRARKALHAHWDAGFALPAPCTACGHTCPESELCAKCGGAPMLVGDRLCVDCDAEARDGVSKWKPKTCDTCEAEGCYWRDDDYNTDGDCLAEK